MSNTDTTTTAPPDTTTTTTTTTPPWHTGIDAETVGFWQNKGYKVDDPKDLAATLTKNYRDLERHMGVPPDQLLKLPKADAKPEEWKALWQKLGAPAEAKDYDFSSIKIAGQDLDPALADSLRGALAAAYTPKDKATSIVAAVAKAIEDKATQDGTLTAAKIAEGKTKLAANWKNNYDFNHLKAMEGARRLGITPDAVKALENQIGYADVMEAMRKIGSATSEDTFVEQRPGGGGTPTTREGAASRKSELMKDNDWVGRYLKGSVAEKNEMDALNTMIAGDQ